MPPFQKKIIILLNIFSLYKLKTQKIRIFLNKNHKSSFIIKNDSNTQDK